ncbi:MULTISPECIES: sigma-70 family RNA polymerase sigma factor [unclassified Carboxylicivirga]|uniref:sigma-70 family RNA polymerase sigma factor n=1 Tax=Carboxylicivirga TaxID=1628153 RepID=UPI003D3347FA
MKREEFKELFDKHFDALRNYIYYRCGQAEQATDIAQEVFMKLWEKQLHKPQNEQLALLYKMARDAIISEYRHRQVELAFMARPFTNGDESSADEALFYKELKTMYEKALKAMPDTQREVFLMSRMDALKYHEIAARLDISVKAVEKRMQKALHYLRLALTVQ